MAASGLCPRADLVTTRLFPHRPERAVRSQSPFLSTLNAAIHPPPGTGCTSVTSEPHHPPSGSLPTPTPTPIVVQAALRGPQRRTRERPQATCGRSVWLRALQRDNQWCVQAESFTMPAAAVATETHQVGRGAAPAGETLAAQGHLCCLQAPADWMGPTAWGEPSALLGLQI